MSKHGTNVVKQGMTKAFRLPFKTQMCMGQTQIQFVSPLSLLINHFSFFSFKVIRTMSVIIFKTIEEPNKMLWRPDYYTS